MHTDKTRNVHGSHAGRKEKFASGGKIKEFSICLREGYQSPGRGWRSPGTTAGIQVSEIGSPV